MSTLLDEAVKRLDPPASALIDQPEVEARVRATIAQAYQSLGLYPPAHAQFAAALECGRIVPGENHLDLANMMIGFADVLRNDEEFDGAERLVDEAERIYLANVGELHDLTIRARIARARIWSKTDRVSEARRLLCELLDQAVRLKGGELNDLVVDVRNGIAIVGHCSGDTGAYLRIMQENIEAQRRLYGENDGRIAVTLLNLGSSHHAMGNYAQAEPLLLEAVEMRKRLYGEDHPAYATVLYNLANVTRHTRGHDEALQQYQQVLAIQERRLVPGHHETTRTQWRLGQALNRLNRFAEAEPYLVAAREAWRARLPARLVSLSHASDELDICLRGQHRFADAEVIVLEMLSLHKQHESSNVAPIQRQIRNLIRLYEEWGSADQADAWRTHLADNPSDQPQTTSTHEQSTGIDD